MNIKSIQLSTICVRNSEHMFTIVYLLRVSLKLSQSIKNCIYVIV